MILLEGKKLNKTFTVKGKTTRALWDVDITLKQGEILGVVGESGSGKTTLLRVIAGTVAPDSGELYYRGEVYTGKKPRQTGEFLQVIFENAVSSFDPRMTMERSISESRRGRADREGLIRILNTVGLDEELLKRKPKELSGGQCQRMSIARALYSKAGILLCDEITSALDVSTQAQVTGLLLELKNKGLLSAVFVSHDIALVSMICDRIMVMYDGRCVEEGDTLNVIGSPVNEYTKLLIDSAVRQGIERLGRSSPTKGVSKITIQAGKVTKNSTTKIKVTTQDKNKKNKAITKVIEVKVKAASGTGTGFDAAKDMKVTTGTQQIYINFTINKDDVTEDELREQGYDVENGKASKTVECETATYTFTKLPGSLEELKTIPLNTKFAPMAAAIAAIGAYQKAEGQQMYTHPIFDEFDYLNGKSEINNVDKSGIYYSMKATFEEGQGSQYAYFEGATPENGYTPNKPYTFTLVDGPYYIPAKTDILGNNIPERRMILISFAGDDSQRYCDTYQSSDGNNYIWDDGWKHLVATMKKAQTQW